MKRTVLLATLLFLYCMCTQQARWRGEQGNGHFDETGLLKQWPDNGPEKILTVQGIGLGYSSGIMANNMIYVSGLLDTMDYLSAINLNGDIKWQIPYGRAWSGSYPETYSTPSVEQNRVYVFSGSGELVNIDAENGSVLWKVNVDKEFESPRKNWGQAESPLIVDNKVIAVPCGDKTTVVAYDKISGELVWKSESLHTEPSWTSPVLYEYNNFSFILAMTSEHLVAVDPETGTFQWVYLYIRPDRIEPLAKKNPYRAWYDIGRLNSVLINTPIFKKDEIFVSMGYNYPAIMLKIDPSGKSVKEKWINKDLDTHLGGFLEIDGYIYGSNWVNNANGNWVCLDWETGNLQYEETWHNKGSIIYSDGMLYCYEEKNGHIALVKPNPEKFEIISSFKMAGSGAHWVHPSIFDGNLLMRFRDELTVFNILDDN